MACFPIGLKEKQTINFSQMWKSIDTFPENPGKTYIVGSGTELLAHYMRNASTKTATSLDLNAHVYYCTGREGGGHVTWEGNAEREVGHQEVACSP